MTGIFILIFVMIAFGTVLGIPKIKGWIGESGVSMILSDLPAEKYRVLNNIMLRSQHGSCQIDHIVVSVYGIFVIETKNYTGWITGSEFSQQWTKNMYGKKYYFHNPLQQNYSHVKVLESLLGISSDKFIPIVVFSVNSELKVKTSKPVIYTTHLKREILSYQEPKFNLPDLDAITKKLIASNIDSKEMRKTHVSNIRTNIEANSESIRNGVCPKCGGALVDRTGKYGTFIGCSNYPKCRYRIKK